ncbi:nucleoside hydrolase [Levilinea saccharolytica]|uniref:Nucleoside hydrolase n=1 Tax=Levilinea saccharolytica TaxID=229921 RepID=A0A0P6Y9U0_9CHLR|nr:nucleoside hydrolase [Levilinea saccharolytica]KPL89841.1 nucleoside hydrolase [Levilinea saccharolytica]GAP16480.1 inosine-uridine nucleoside N-ribohydrolase [Levilinea saccharolytica]
MRKFWIDTDTASDDAVAILMALRWPDVDVVGISTVSGNVPVEMCAVNARYTVELCGKDTPVYLGAAKPLLREASYAYFFHGPDGMGGMNYPAPRRPLAEGHAVQALIDAVRAHPGEITLVTLGPLTNVALALALAPDLAQKIPVCYVMGGAAATLGNVTPAAEFNIWVDPEAAKMVFHSGLRLVMVGWELCRGEANLSEADMAEVRGFGTVLADFSLDCNRQAIETNRTWLKDPALPLPDPVTMAVALDPSVSVRQSSHYVDVEILSEVTRGMTVVDERGVLNRAANVEVCWEIDIPKWKETLYRTLR